MEGQETIQVEVNTRIQENELLKDKTNLLLFLRKDLNNNRIDLNIIVKKEEKGTSTKVFTAADKLNAMMLKNPALKTLKEKFNLDIN